MEPREQPCPKALDLQAALLLVEEPLERGRAGQHPRRRHDGDDDGGAAGQQANEPGPVAPGESIGTQDGQEGEWGRA